VIKLQIERPKAQNVTIGNNLGRLPTPEGDYAPLFSIT
jgi:hypothetical protein